MAGSGGAEIDRVLEIVVGEINSLAEPQADGPPVVLTLGGSVVSGTIIPDWQWFDEVEHAAPCGVHGAYRGRYRRRARWLGEAVPRPQRVPGPGPRGAPRRAERGRRSVRALPTATPPGGPHQLHPPERPGCSPLAAALCHLAGCTGGDDCPRSQGGPSDTSMRPPPAV